MVVVKTNMCAKLDVIPNAAEGRVRNLLFAAINSSSVHSWPKLAKGRGFSHL
jgi:hypothetical protein